MADLKEIEAKAARGEALSAEETREVMSSPPEGIAPALEPGDEIDWGQAEDLDHPKPKDKAKAPATPTPSEKKADTPPPAKKPDEKPAEKPPADDMGAPEVNMEKLEAELSKDEGKEDLKDFSGREKAYFHSMRRDRKARQQAEADRDIALRKLALAPKAPEKPAVDPDDPVEVLKKKDPTDFVSVADVLKIVESVKTPAKKDEAPAAAGGISAAGMKYLKLCDKEAADAHPEDYAEVMELTSDIIDINPAYLKEVERRTIAGENPAEVAYSLIKGDPEFSKLFPVAKTKVASRKVKKPDAAVPAKSAEDLEKERKAKETQDALEANKTKTKTSGHASGEGAGRDDSGKYTDGKLSFSSDELTKMSDLEYAKVPKKIRKAFMEDISK